MIAIAGVSMSVATLLAISRWRAQPQRLRSLPRRGAAPTGAGPTRRAHPDRRRSSVRTVTVEIVVIFAVVLVLGPFAAAAGAAVVALWPRVAAIRDQRRTSARAVLAYPDVVDLLVLSIRSGYSPRQAVAALIDVVPAAAVGALDTVLQRTDTGQRFAEAVDAIWQPAPAGLGPVARPLADALALADRYGTPLAPILDRLADEARAQRRRNADAAARRLPVQLAFPLVGCTLPSFVLLTVVPLMAGTFSSLPRLTA